jgi:hypothetical protein
METFTDFIKLIALLLFLVGAGFLIYNSYTDEVKNRNQCMTLCQPYAIVLCDKHNKLVVCNSNEGKKVIDLK